MRKIMITMLAALAFVNALAQEAEHKLSADASGFVALTDVVPDVILEVRYHSTFNFVGERIDGYEQPIVLLTKEAANALKHASEIVKEKGYRLKVYDGYRPQKAVDHFVRWAKNLNDTLMKPQFYPELSKDELFPKDYICLYSGHTRGSTVDLTLFDMQTGQEADMGGNFDYFGEKSHPDYRGVTPRQWENRMTLREAMIKAGFNPFDSEWWHFTLKDEPYPSTYFTFPVNEKSISNTEDRKQ